MSQSRRELAPSPANRPRNPTICALAAAVAPRRQLENSQNTFMMRFFYIHGRVNVDLYQK